MNFKIACAALCACFALSGCIVADVTYGVAKTGVKAGWFVTKTTAKGVGYAGKAVIPGGDEDEEKKED